MGLLSTVGAHWLYATTNAVDAENQRPGDLAIDHDPVTPARASVAPRRTACC